jgi:polygalacturonase
LKIAAFAIAGICLLAAGCSSNQLQNPAAATFQGRSFNIASYGAVADGKTPNTNAIQKAIDACARAGRGRVLIPAGTFLSGPIALSSNLDFHLNAGAKLIFSRDFDQYPLVAASFLGKDTVQCTSPITARNCHDLSLTGPGVIDGQGDAWRPVKRSKLSPAQWDALVNSGGATDAKKSEWWPTRSAMQNERALNELRDSDAPPHLDDYAKFRDLLRPNMVALIGCDHLLIDGPTFRNSPFWAVQVQRCDHVIVRNSTIYNELWAQNGDGIGFDSSRNILMENCTVYAGDDNVTLKSGKDAEGRRYHLPTENVLIRHCTSMWGHGGFVLGSEISGDIRNVKIVDCTCNGTDVGLRFKSVRGRGGVVENVCVERIHMVNIQKQAILFDMYYEQENSPPEPLSERTPRFQKFDLRDIDCQSSGQSVLIDGLAELPISQLRFSHLHLIGETGARLTQVRDVALKDVWIQSDEEPAFSTENVANIHVRGLTTSVKAGK